jgi:EpsI family protein
VAYYGSQRSGASVHSPRSCIPGGGWLITDLTQIRVDDVVISGKPLQVNRAVIKKGDMIQLVYFWFQQRGRIINNEYMVKWYLFWDALTRNRTDGSLVRLTTFIAHGQDIDEADELLTSFAREVSGVLADYIPD